MSRTRMDWDWVGHYPFFVFTTWIDNGKFNVKIVKGTKDNQNAGNTGPSAPAWKEYIQEGYASKEAVVKQAFKIIRREIRKE